MMIFDSPLIIFFKGNLGYFTFAGVDEYINF